MNPVELWQLTESASILAPPTFAGHYPGFWNVTLFLLCIAFWLLVTGGPIRSAAPQLSWWHFLWVPFAGLFLLTVLVDEDRAINIRINSILLFLSSVVTGVVATCRVARSSHAYRDWHVWCDWLARFLGFTVALIGLIEFLCVTAYFLPASYPAETAEQLRMFHRLLYAEQQALERDGHLLPLSQLSVRHGDRELVPRSLREKHLYSDYRYSLDLDYPVKGMFRIEAKPVRGSGGRGFFMTDPACIPVQPTRTPYYASLYRVVIVRARSGRGHLASQKGLSQALQDWWERRKDGPVGDRPNG